MKFSGKMCRKVISKVTKSQGSTFSLEDTFFEEPNGWKDKIDPPPPNHFRVKGKIMLLK